jgi:cytochrome P450
MYMSTDTHDPAEKSTSAYEDASRYGFNDQQYAKNPFALWKQFRETPGLLHSDQDGGFWILSRFSEVRQAAAQEKTFCARLGRVIPPHSGTFLPSDSDGPLHRQYRRLLNPWLSAEAVAPFEPEMHATCAEILDSLAVQEDFDMSRDYAIPAILIAGLKWLGWPVEDAELLAEWTHAILAPAVVIEPDVRAQAWQSLSDYITRQIEQRRSEPRREDITQAILDAEIEQRPISFDEVLQLIISVFLGAVHTTASALSSSLQYLANHPEARELLTRAEPDQWELAVEEFLRVAGTNAHLARTVDEDTEVAGCPLKKGEKVALLFSSANLDALEFPDPDEVILDRSPNRHMAFGHGPHKCAGAPFARLMLRVAIHEAIDRLGNFRIADEDQVGVESWTTRIVTSIPMIHEPR